MFRKLEGTELENFELKFNALTNYAKYFEEENNIDSLIKHASKFPLYMALSEDYQLKIGNLIFNRKLNALDYFKIYTTLSRSELEPYITEFEKEILENIDEIFSNGKSYNVNCEVVFSNLYFDKDFIADFIVELCKNETFKNYNTLINSYTEYVKKAILYLKSKEDFNAIFDYIGPNYRSYPLIINNRNLSREDKKEILKRTFRFKDVSEYAKLLREGCTDANDIDVFLEVAVLENNRVIDCSESIVKLFKRIFFGNSRDCYFESIFEIKNLDKLIEKYQKYITIEQIVSLVTSPLSFIEREKEKFIKLFYENVPFERIISDVKVVGSLRSGFISVNEFNLLRKVIFNIDYLKFDKWQLRDYILAIYNFHGHNVQELMVSLSKYKSAEEIVNIFVSDDVLLETIYETYGLLGPGCFEPSIARANTDYLYEIFEYYYEKYFEDEEIVSHMKSLISEEVLLQLGLNDGNFENTHAFGFLEYLMVMLKFVNYSDKNELYLKNVFRDELADMLKLDEDSNDAFDRFNNKFFKIINNGKYFDNLVFTSGSMSRSEIVKICNNVGSVKGAFAVVFENIFNSILEICSKDMFKNDEEIQKVIEKINDTKINVNLILNI